MSPREGGDIAFLILAFPELRGSSQSFSFDFHSVRETFFLGRRTYQKSFLHSRLQMEALEGRSTFYRQLPVSGGLETLHSPTSTSLVAWVVQGRCRTAILF